MLQAIRLRSQHKQQQPQQLQLQKKGKKKGRRSGKAVVQQAITAGGGLCLSLLFVALGSAIGGYHQPSTLVSSSHIRQSSCFLGRRGSKTPDPAASEQITNLADRFRNIGAQLRLREGEKEASAGSGAGKKASDMAASNAKKIESSSNGNGSGAKTRPSGRNSFLAGGLAGSISTTITCPIEVRSVFLGYLLTAVGRTGAASQSS